MEGTVMLVAGVIFVIVVIYSYSVGPAAKSDGSSSSTTSSPKPSKPSKPSSSGIKESGSTEEASTTDSKEDRMAKLRAMREKQNQQ